MDGAHLPLNEQLTVDTVELVLSAFSGTFEGGPGSALSEIEVIGRAVEGGTPAISYLRGDANCDAAVSLSDAIHLLGHLFLSEGPLCCTAGAEASGDGIDRNQVAGLVVSLRGDGLHNEQLLAFESRIFARGNHGADDAGENHSGV